MSDFVKQRNNNLYTKNFRWCLINYGFFISYLRLQYSSDTVMDFLRIISDIVKFQSCSYSLSSGVILETCLLSVIPSMIV